MAFIKEGSVSLDKKLKLQSIEKLPPFVTVRFVTIAQLCPDSTMVCMDPVAKLLKCRLRRIAEDTHHQTHPDTLISAKALEGGEEFHIVLSVAMRVSSAHTRHTKWWKMKKASHESHDLDKVFYIDDALPHAYNTWRHVHIISTRKFNQRRRHFEEWPDQSESRKNKLVTLNVRSQTWRLSLSQPVLPISKQMNLHQNIMFACFFGFWVWGPSLLLSCGWNDDHTYPQADFCLEKTPTSI